MAQERGDHELAVELALRFSTDGTRRPDQHSELVLSSLQEVGGHGVG